LTATLLVVFGFFSILISGSYFDFTVKGGEGCHSTFALKVASARGNSVGITSSYICILTIERSAAIDGFRFMLY